MENQNQIQSQSNFDGIPALGDNQGLQNYMNQDTLANLGIQQNQIQGQQQDQNQANQSTDNASQGTQPQGAPSVSQEQIQAILANLNAINSRLGNGAQQQQVQRQMPQQQYRQQVQPINYTPNEQAFIAEALRRGYSLDQINQTIMSKRGANNVNPEMERRVAAMEQAMRDQEYRAAESAFVDKLSNFGEKWGLSEEDLVTFGQAAYNQGINIAQPNVNLEAVFRAVYPEQYAIRLQRMTPSQTSQIYGGNSIPEGNRQMASKAEDAYVEAFLRQSMPNYGRQK